MRTNTKFIVKIGVLSGLASVVMFLEMPLPLMPSFLKFDFSLLISLLGAFSLGPLAGVFIELVKNLAHLASSITGGIGELASFLVGCAFVVPASIIYNKRKSIKTAIIGLIIGALSMVIVATISNYYFLIPLYIEIFAKQYNITADQSLKGIVELGTKENNAIIDLRSLIMFGVVPFNIIKTAVISVLTFFTYKKVSTILHK